MKTTQEATKTNKEKGLALKIAEAMLNGDIPALMLAQVEYNEYKERPIEATKRQPTQRRLKKQCKFCREMKFTTEFHRSEKNADGLQHRCKPCNNRTKNTNKRVIIVPIEVYGKEIDHRYCKICEDLKPLDEFSKNGRGGKMAQCKPCYRAKQRKGYAIKKALAAKRDNGNVS